MSRKQIDKPWVVAPQWAIDDAGVSIASGRVTFYQTYEEAVAGANARLDRRTYNGMVIHHATMLVRRTAPPIDVIPLDEDGGYES